MTTPTKQPYFLDIRLKLVEGRLEQIDKIATGPQGPPGPRPKHRWIDGTKLQFETATGEWGIATELRGPAGVGGGAGGLGAQGPAGATGPAGPPGGGSGGNAASAAIAWFFGSC